MTKEQFEQRFMEHNSVTGFGLDTTVHMPCPFCAAPEFMVFRVIHSDEAMQSGGLCKECGRGMKCVMTRNDTNVSFQMVQTCGDEPPEWARMRRVEVSDAGTK